MLSDATSCLQGGVELKLPDAKSTAYDLRPGSLNQAASDPEVAARMEECLTDWCRQVSLAQARFFNLAGTNNNSRLALTALGCITCACSPAAVQVPWLPSCWTRHTRHNVIAIQGCQQANMVLYSIHMPCMC